MSSVLKIKDKNGNWIDIPAIIGLSAYEVAVKHGYDGTEEEWLESLKGKTPHIGVNGNWYIGEYDTGVKADVSEALESLEQTLRDHGMFINAEMPVYLGELRDLVNNAPKDAEGNIIESASKESVDTMKVLFPKDIMGNPVNLNTLLAFNKMGMPVSLKDILLYDMIGDPVDLKDIWLYDNIGRPVDLKSIMPTDAYGAPVSLKTLLPVNVLGKHEVLASKQRVDNLDNKLSANILKGSASGTIVSMKDVSPIEHEMGVRVRRKNEFYLNETKARTAGGLSFNLTQGQSSFVVNGTSTTSSSAKLTEIPLKAGTYSIAIYGANAITTDMDRIFLQYTTNGNTATINNIMDGKTKTFTLPYDVTVTVSFVFAEASTYENKEICIQIEEGTTATAYAPYVPDISAVKLKAYEQNLLNIDAGINKSFVKNGDGTYTLTKQDGNRLTGKIPFDYPNTSFSLYVEIVDTNIDGLNGISTMFKNAEETKTQYPRMTPDGKCTLIDTGGRSGLIQLYIDNTMSNGSYITFKNPQIAVSSTPITEYKPYVEPVEYSVSAVGTSKVASIHPVTTLCADTDGVIIDVDYNRDINIAFKNLEDKITALSAAMI